MIPHGALPRTQAAQQKREYLEASEDSKPCPTTKEQSRRIAKAAKTRASESQRGLKAWSG